MSSKSTSWTDAQREVLDSLRLLSQLNEGRQLGSHSVKNSTVSFHDSIWSSLTQLLSSKDSQKLLSLIARVRTVIDQALQFLSRELTTLCNSEDPVELEEALARIQILSQQIIKASKGLHTQFVPYSKLQGVPRRLARLLMYNYQQVQERLGDPEVSAAIYRCLATNSSKVTARIHSLSLNAKHMVAQILHLKDSKSLNSKEIHALLGTEERSRRLWRTLFRLLWERPKYLNGLPLSISPALKEELRDPLQELTRESTAVQVLQRFFNTESELPSFTVNGREILLNPDRRPRHYMQLCTLLLAAVDRASILPAMGVQLEEFGATLADYMQKSGSLLDDEETNDVLTDLPAPDCVGKLMRLFQPMLFDPRVLLGPKLAPLTMMVAPGEEAASDQPWTVKIDMQGPSSTISQSRDYVIGDFMGKPLAYITLEHDMWRESGLPWQVIAVRCSYIRFFRGINDKQRDFVVDNLALSKELKAEMRGLD